MLQASIISIGDELLIGQVTNTNATWMAQRLNGIGVKVFEAVAVPDDAGHIKNALGRALQHCEIVLLTGGLGPTKDDITKKTLAEYFGTPLVVDEGIMSDLERYFKSRNRPLPESVRGMAYLPEACEVLRNHKGTAAAMWFAQGSKSVVSMPGVPREMEDFMDRLVLPRLARQYDTPHILHRTLWCAGLGESMVAEKIAAVEDALPAHIKLAYLPGMGVLRLRLSASGSDAGSLQREVGEAANAIKAALTDKYFFGEGETSLARELGQLLLQRNATLVTAESCTGGLVAHNMTGIPGSSAYFRGGLVVYSNDLKMQLCGVRPETLEQYGAVSEQTVGEMAMGAAKRLNADYAVAVSGIAGPGGGTPEKPVGTVWVAAGTAESFAAKKLFFPSTRDITISISANYALAWLRRFVLGRV